jgi:uncharacterized protein
MGHMKHRRLQLLTFLLVGIGVGTGVFADIPESSHILSLRDVPELSVPFSHEFLSPDGNKSELSRRIRSIMDAATRGERNAQLQLGRLYDEGFGVPINPAEAFSWYRKAAEQGLAEAQYLVGRGYAFADGTAQDEVEAIRWYRKAVAQDYLPAIHNLGMACLAGRGETNIDEGFRLLKRAADKGVPHSQLGLGIAYSDEKHGRLDLSEAARLFRLAAEQNFAPAEWALGDSYLEGRGVKRDLGQAENWV